MGSLVQAHPEAQKPRFVSAFFVNLQTQNKGAGQSGMVSSLFVREEPLERSNAIVYYGIDFLSILNVVPYQVPTELRVLGIVERWQTRHSS